MNKIKLCEKPCKSFEKLQSFLKMYIILGYQVSVRNSLYVSSCQQQKTVTSLTSNQSWKFMINLKLEKWLELIIACFFHELNMYKRAHDHSILSHCLHINQKWRVSLSDIKLQSSLNKEAKLWWISWQEDLTYSTIYLSTCIT